MIRVRLRRQPDRPHYTLYYDDPATGKEVTRSAKTADRGQAERAAADWERELLEFRGSNDDGWEWIVDRFFRERMASRKKSTRSAVATSLRRYRALMSPSTPASVTTDGLSRYTALLIGQGLEQATAAKDLKHLKLFLRWCANVAGVIKSAPYVPIPKQGKRRFMRGRALTEAEYKRMLRHAPSPAWRRFLELLYLSGLRIEEASELSWDEPPHIVHLDAKPFPQILFYGADDDGQKSGKDEAWPIPPDLAAWLRKTPPGRRTGLVAPLSIRNRSDLSKAVTRIGRAAKVITNSATGKPASAHDLRRSFGTRWALKVPPVVLQKLMRHETIETTMKYYVNLEASQIGSVLWNGKQPTRKPSRVRGRVRK
jgi:integrase